MVVGKTFEVEGTGFYGGILAFVFLGFLLQNWQPAKIFMGDVGSAFLGFSFAVLPLLAKKAREDLQVVLFITAVILFWLFLWDSLLTLLKRIWRGEKVWQAHRGHIYQRLVGSGFSHQYVTCLYSILSILNGSLLLLWLNFRNSFGYILVIFIGLQSIGLLIFLKAVEKK